MKRKILIIFVILLLILLSSCAKKAENTSIPELKDEPAEVVDTDTSAIFPDTIFRDIQISVPLNTDETKKEGVVTEKENHYADDSIKPLLPKMIEIRDEKNNLNIEISETLVTMEEYKLYLVQTNPSRAENFESWAKEFNDGTEFQKDCPMCFLSWREAAEYCNWLSNEKGLQPVYSYNFYDEPVIDTTANGYRFPYVRELLILSGMKDGLSKEEYESENFCQKKDYPFPVYEGKKNKYGIYDLLGNLPQYCNDYYLRGYDYLNFENNPYGPDEYTNDEAPAFWVDGKILYDDTKRIPLLCAFGCYCRRVSYESVMERVVIGTNIGDKMNSISIRVVRNINF
ncbi:MAG: SUMF1/EgtB/PvdO family nonheme iron enzyme [Spirochaetaceae bacterium]|nr:SUMF1/EgtB/PvdO family nonheme iron enzyme [Spirochaetaceae bacterium]